MAKVIHTFSWTASDYSSCAHWDVSGKRGSFLIQNTCESGYGLASAWKRGSVFLGMPKELFRSSVKPGLWAHEGSQVLGGY